ncbi:MAG TPA: C10 family peptidase, partial [Pontiellaceae bacterium]|nr:C10 family peptidase [Pontiellaceae bacterium]
MGNKIRRVFFAFGCVLLFREVAVGSPVTQDQAAQAANTFITLTYPSGGLQTAMTTTAAGQSARAVQSVRPVVGSGGQTIGYVAELDSTGYVLLSSDDEAPPVKCYTDSGTYDQLPPEFLNILNLELAEDLSVLSGMTQTKSGGFSGVSQTQSAGVSGYKEQWLALLNPALPTKAPEAMSTSAAAGTVLLTTTWDQADPYNYYCPSAVGGPGGRSYAGCTACAVSQILRYWSRPNAILSGHSYYDSKGSCTGNRSISDAGMTAYNWANMPSLITTGSSTLQKQAVGQLMYHAAVALDSDFESSGTAAYPTDVPSVLRTYFAYACSNYSQKASFTSTGWYNQIASDVG